MADFKNDSGLPFTDISSERERVYDFGGGRKVIIASPIKLNVSSSGGHRLWDATGTSHYIPAVWIHLSWTVKDGAPNFVK